MVLSRFYQGDEGRAERHLSPKKLPQSSLTSSYTSSATRSSFHETLARQKKLGSGVGVGHGGMGYSVIRAIDLQGSCCLFVPTFHDESI
jgi:hypothetical protein